MTNNTDLVRVHDALRVLATLLRTPEFMAQFDPEKFAGKLERIADALAQQPAPVGDDPIDAKDNAGYIEHCADRLERLGHRVTAGALRVIAIEHRALAQQHAAPSGEAVWGQSGMSLRDYFAAQELAKKDSTDVRDTPEAYARLAAHCYRMADAMLNARKQQGGRADG